MLSTPRSIVVGLVLMVSAAPTVGAQPPGASRQERAVLDAVLKECCRSTNDTVVLTERTAQFRAPGPPPSIPGQIPGSRAVEWRRMPQQLMSRLDSLSREPRLTTSLDVPPPFVILPDSTQRGFFESGVERGWTAFRRRYPGTSGFSRLSPVVLSPDQQEALVYVEHHCGGLCGEGTLYRLRWQRDGWVVVGKLGFWVS